MRAFSRLAPEVGSDPEGERGPAGRRDAPQRHDGFPAGVYEGREVEGAEAVEFIVCGDPARNQVQILAGSPGTALKEVTLPARWDELKERAGYRPLKGFFLK